MRSLVLVFFLISTLEAQVADTKISIDGGFDTDGIDVELTTATEETFIVYTGDGALRLKSKQAATTLAEPSSISISMSSIGDSTTSQNGWIAGALRRTLEATPTNGLPSVTVATRAETRTAIALR